MITGDMQCAYCGLTGKIDGYRAGSEGSATAVFAYRGHNPVSGHIHYQCPSCSIVQLIAPMDILEGKMASGLSGLAPSRIDSFGRIAAGALHRLNDFRKALPLRLLPGNVGLLERRG